MKRAIAIGFGLLLAAPAWAQDAVSFKVAKNHIDVMIGKELFTRYHTAGYAKPIFWPLHAPGNVPLTRDWPMVEPERKSDHPHQKSAWFCHGDVIPEGLKLAGKIKNVAGVDFWSEATGHGNIVCTEIGKPVVDAGAGSLITSNQWLMSDGTKIMDETRNLQFYNFGKARLIVLTIRLDATVAPIVFGDTKEGSMGIRVNEQMEERKGGVLQNAEGKKTEKECWGLKSDWCDYSGTVDGKKVGLTVLADPKNPQPVCFHARGYGLLAANPFGRERSRFPGVKGQTELVRLDKGASITFRFGLLAHEGDAGSGQVADYFKRFIELRGRQ